MKKITFILTALLFTAVVFGQKTTGLIYQAPKAKAGITNHSRADFFEGFEDGIPATWTVIDNDTDGNQWHSNSGYTTTPEAYEGDSCATLLCNTTGSDDWLISPAITIYDGYELNFYATSIGSDWSESLNVKISTTTAEMSSFTINLNTESEITNYWRKYTCFPTDHIVINDGDVIYIAIQITSVDNSIIKLDNFSVAHTATYDIDVTGVLSSAYTIIPEFFTPEFTFETVILGLEIPVGQIINVYEVGGTYTGTGTVNPWNYWGDTVPITPAFTPTMKDTYNIVFHSEVAGETNCSNNYDTVRVTVSDTVYARDLGPDGGTAGIGYTSPGILGQLFEIEGDAYLTSVTFQLGSPTAETATVKLYAFNGTTVTGPELATSATISINTKATAEFSEYTATIEASLSAGTYFIGIEEPSEGVIGLATSLRKYSNWDYDTWIYYQNVWSYVESTIDYNQTYVLRANITNSENTINNNAVSEISIYPNPTNNVVNIANAENSNITVINMLGQVVSSTVANSNLVSINTSNLVEGTYLVRITNGNEVTTQKINVIR